MFEAGTTRGRVSLGLADLSSDLMMHRSEGPLTGDVRFAPVEDDRRELRIGAVTSGSLDESHQLLLDPHRPVLGELVREIPRGGQQRRGARIEADAEA